MAAVEKEKKGEEREKGEGGKEKELRNGGGGGSLLLVHVTLWECNRMDCQFSFSVPFCVFLSDRGERPDVRHPLHLQRASRVPGVLAHLLHHGRPVLRRQVLQVRGRGGQPPHHRRRQRQIRVRREELHLGQLQDHLRPRWARLPRPLPGKGPWTGHKW